MDRDSLKARLQFLTSVCAGLAKMTPTDMDDKLVAGLGALAEQDWFLDLVITLLTRKTPPTAGEVVELLNSVAAA